MSRFTSWQGLRDARQDALDAIIEKHKEVLFGTPPKVSSTGKLFGATPPNMEVLTRLFKK